jgi:hypothetical protein
LEAEQLREALLAEADNFKEKEGPMVGKPNLDGIVNIEI